MRTGFLRRTIAAILFGVIAAAPVAAAACEVRTDLDLTEADLERLGGLERSRMVGLAEALFWEEARDRETVGLLFRDGLPQPETELVAGSYQCRTIKLGGLLPLTVYDWFRCEITPEAQAFTIRKITGSQNFTGTLFPAGSGYLYRGAGHYGNEQPRFYGDDEERDQVGCFRGVTPGATHFVLELPSPRFESLHDVIEFRRMQ